MIGTGRIFGRNGLWRCCRLVLHCLSVYGRPVKRTQHDDSAGRDVWELEEAKVTWYSHGNVLKVCPAAVKIRKCHMLGHAYKYWRAPERSLYAEQVCRHFGMKLLREQKLWLASDFMARWRADVPEARFSYQEAPQQAVPKQLIVSRSSVRAHLPLAVVEGG